MRDHYAEEVAESLTKDDWGEPEPIYGHRFGAQRREQARSRTFSLSIFAGSTYPKRFPNDITFYTRPRCIPDPAAVTYEIFKPVLRAAAC
ncbi:MAG: hypothetical protein ACREDM_07035 [Methylocella sp.]